MRSASRCGNFGIEPAAAQRRDHGLLPVSGRLPAQIAVFLSASALGGSFVATRYLMADAAPSTLAFLRFGLAVMCLLPFVPWRQFRKWRRRDLLILVIIGMLQFGIFHYFINSALAIIPASRGAVIFAMIPILTMLIAALFRVEPLQLRRLTAGLLAVLGVGLALSEKAFVSTVPPATGPVNCCFWPPSVAAVPTTPCRRGSWSAMASCR